MKDAFQQQADEGDMMIGPNGRPVMTPEALMRKQARDRAKAEDVSAGLAAKMPSEKLESTLY